MEARLPASLTAGALLRLAQAQGGFGTIVAKGDEQAGSILVILAERGRETLLCERVLQSNGVYAWQHRPCGDDLDMVLAKRRHVDADLWIMELDVASAERFAAEMKQLG